MEISELRLEKAVRKEAMQILISEGRVSRQKQGCLNICILLTQMSQNNYSDTWNFAFDAS